MRENINLIRSNRRTISLEITSMGEILVRAPRRMPEADIRAFVEAKESWIAKQIIPKKVAYYARLMGVTYGRMEGE